MNQFNGRKHIRKCLDKAFLLKYNFIVSQFIAVSV